MDGEGFSGASSWSVPPFFHDGKPAAPIPAL
jgi:hypothetical protein